MSWIAIRNIAVLIILTLTFAYGYHRGAVKATAELEAFKAQTAAQGEIQRAKNAQIKAQQDQTAKEIGDAYARNIDALRAYYGRLLNRARSGGMPAPAEAPRSIDEVPSDALPLAAECAETTQQLIDLQDWVKQVTAD